MEDHKKTLDEILESVESNDASYEAALERLTTLYMGDFDFQRFFYDRFFSWENQSLIDRGFLEESDAIQDSFDNLLFEKDIEILNLHTLIG